MITKVTFRTYSDYANGITTNDVSYTTNILNIAYPDLKLFEDWSFFAQSPSSFSFGLFLDEWSINELLDASKRVAAWSKYVCLIYDEDVLFFTGIIPADSIKYDTDSNVLSLTVYDFLSLLSKNGNMQLPFTDRSLLDDIEYYKEPFFAGRLQNENDIFRFIITNAEAVYFQNFTYCTSAEFPDGIINIPISSTDALRLRRNVELGGGKVIKEGICLSTSSKNYLSGKTRIMVKAYCIGKGNEDEYLISSCGYGWYVSHAGNFTQFQKTTATSWMNGAFNIPAVYAPALINTKNNFIKFDSGFNGYEFSHDSTILSLGANVDQIVSSVNIGRIFYKAIFSGNADAGYTFTIYSGQFSDDQRAAEFPKVFDVVYPGSYFARFNQNISLLRYNLAATKYLVATYDLGGNSGQPVFYDETNTSALTSSKTLGVSGFYLKSDGILRYYRFRLFVWGWPNLSTKFFYMKAIYVYSDLDIYSNNNSVEIDTWSDSWSGSTATFDQYLVRKTDLLLEKGSVWLGAKDAIVTYGLSGGLKTGLENFSLNGTTYSVIRTKDEPAYNSAATPGNSIIDWLFSFEVKATGIVLPPQTLTAAAYTKMLLAYNNLVMDFDQATNNFRLQNRTDFSNTVIIDQNDIIELEQQQILPETIDFSEFGELDLALQYQINQYYNDFYSKVTHKIKCDISSLFNSYSLKLGDIIGIGSLSGAGYIITKIKKVNDSVVAIEGIVWPDSYLIYDENGTTGYIIDENNNKIILGI